MKYLFSALLSILLVVPLIAHATPGDDRFLAAREAFRVGDADRVARMAESLNGHDLQPWAEYWRLSLLLNSTANSSVNAQANLSANSFAVQESSKHIDTQVEEFLSRNEGSYLAEKLRGDWLRALGKRAAWNDFLAQYASLGEPAADLLCYSWQARLAIDDERGVLEDARDLWLSPNDVPAACAPLIDRLVNDKRITISDIWMRIHSLLEVSRYGDAQAAAAYLTERQMPDTKTLERIAAKPTKYLDHLPPGFSARRQLRETTMFAMLRQARDDTADAASRWRNMETRFDRNERGYVWGQLALLAARKHMSEALAWFDLADDAPLSDEQMAWRVRAALRVNYWSEVLNAIDRMPDRLSARPEWVYWRGRALAATGRNDDALTLYRSISAQPIYYGILAAEELGLPLALPPRASAPTPMEFAAAEVNPGLRQALALFRLDMRAEGVRTWNWSVRHMDDRELLAAAELARRNDVFDRAISTADRTLAEHNYSLRYLSPYRDTVSPKALALALDDSWVYGLMRQESRFVTSARSGVGARGLMQVMPSTAKLVARKIGMANYQPGHVDSMETNVTLGTHYLKMVLDSLDNQPVLACTAYNAGPGRAQRWRGPTPMEGAIYTETIPFSETRDYVKKVMANSVFYSALFEETPRTLKSRLGIIQPRNAVLNDTIVNSDESSESPIP